MAFPINPNSQLRDRFVDEFGEDMAAIVEATALDHTAGEDYNPGSDRFRWSVLTCIGYECFGRFAKEHGFDFEEMELQAWALDNKDSFDAHDGDFDVLAMFAGSYNFLRDSQEEAPPTQQENTA